MSSLWEELRILNGFSFVFPLIALLCGLNGYASFLDENVVKEIVEWQVELGCYEYFEGSLDIPTTTELPAKKQKRDAIKLNGNCSDHMTGLAAATFGLFAKLTNQYYYNHQ